MRANQQRAEHNIGKGKRNRTAVMAAVSMAALLLTGCGNVIPDMTEDEEQAMGEYAAMLLLKYDANSRSRLVEALLEEAPPEEEPEAALPEEKPEESQGMDPVADTPVVDMPPENMVTENFAGSMEALLGLPEGLSLGFQGTQTCASYPESGEMDGYFSLDASAGKSLLVLHYTLSNQSGADQNVDILNQNAVFKVTVNGDYTRTALVTMLMDDMSGYVGTVAAGGSEELVLLIEIDQGMENSITSVSLNVQNDMGEFQQNLL